MPRGDGHCDMRLGVDRRGSRSAVQSALGGGLRDGSIGAGQIHCQSALESLAKHSRPRCIAGPAHGRGDDGAGDKPRSGDDVLRESAGDAETDDTLRAARKFAFERKGKLSRVAATGDCADTRTRGDACLYGKPCDCDDSPGNAWTDAHMPKRMWGSLERIMLR